MAEYGPDIPILIPAEAEKQAKQFGFHHVIGLHVGENYRINDKWIFAAPFSAYVTCIIGILWIPLILTLYLLVRSRRDEQNKKTNKWAFYGLSSLSIVICYFAVMNYYYINEEGITYHHLFRINETHYAWGEMTEVNQVVKSNDGITYTDRIEFVINNHKKINIPYSSQYLEISGRIQETLRKNGIPFQIVPD